MIDRAIALCVAALAVPFGAAFAQSGNGSAPAPAPHTVTLRVDNDAFDFWMLPWNRPDAEYTSGVRITYDGGNAPVWSRRLLGAGLPACTTSTTACRTSRAELGQDIYTPAVSVDDPHAAPGSRPSAGWLYVDQSARVLRTDRSDELGITLGVTGPPSLGEQMQRFAHSVAPSFNRPADWTRQIGFEPGIDLRYERRQLLASEAAGDVGVDIAPRLQINLGNVATNAELGLDARAGWNIGHPWLPHLASPEVALSAGAWARGVARDLFLDGNTFGDSPHVGHEPLVEGGSAGVELRFAWLTLGYRAVSESRAYALGPKWHPWSSLIGGVTFGR